ncbi:pancreatic secretory granule membrane major glycoprotein GP2-like [Protopterus annectens]|uniref:pancreatic secretory granule membrane major glycoprotein GP2-like n=1 Tax=Protopterus annectens TaxID=7888 RepID=UPI001CF99F33|nr:pancreatic secretory granule membrane major glycoprotein GP2-like [Protopterus annectens]
MKTLLTIILTIGFIKQASSQCKRPCLPDEVCQPFTSLINESTSPPVTFSGYECNCISTLYDNPDFKALLKQLPISCNPLQFSVNISSCLGRTMSEFDYLLPDENIQENQCFNKVYSPDFGIATFNYNFTSSDPNCVAVISVNATHVTTSINVLFETNKTAPMIFYNDINVNYSCSYPLNYNVSLDVGLNPYISTNNISVTGSGTYVTTMQLYKYSDYTVPYKVSDMPIRLTVESPLYIGASVQGADPKLFLKVSSCYATPTQYSNDSVQYPIIAGGCPIPGSPGVHFDLNGVAHVVYFYIKLFKFTTSETVYLHCTFTLCSTDCLNDCSQKSLGDNNDPATPSHTAGPIDQVKNGNGVSTSGAGTIACTVYI